MMKTTKLLLPLIGLSGFLMAPTCGDPITIPLSDPTLPSYNFLYQINGGDAQQVPAGGISETILADDEVYVVLIGADREGVREIILDGFWSYSCGKSNYGFEQTDPVTYSTYENEAPTGQAYKQAYTEETISPQRCECPDGWTPLGQRFDVTGSVENFFNGFAYAPMLSITADCPE